MARFCVHVGAEYTLEWPLWDASEATECDIDSLPLSQRVCTDLRRWAMGYRSTVFEPDETSTPAFAAWVEEGRHLARRLKQELGAEYDVTYWNELTSETETV